MRHPCRWFFLGMLAAGIVGSAGCRPVREKLEESAIRARETIALHSIHTLHTAQEQHWAMHGRHARSLAELGPRGAGLIPADLAGGTKSGYTFTTESTGDGYVIQARPAAYGKTGRRSFHSDQTGIVRQNGSDAPATASSPEVK